MNAAIPSVEVAHDTDALGIGRPNREARAGHAVYGAELGAELVVDTAFIAFAEEIQIRLPQSGKKGIGIAHLADIAGVFGDSQVISVHAVGLVSGRLEDVRALDAVEFEGGLVVFVNRPKLNVGGIGHKRAGNQTGAVGQWMESKELVRRATSSFDETFEFFVSQGHGARTLTGEAGSG